jgi:hypothetical protein
LALLAAACGGSDERPAAEVAAPAIAEGDLGTGRVEIEGTEIDYVSVVPNGFVPGDLAPVLLALPPGRQDLGLATSFTTSTYLAQAVERGWVVVSPAAPGGVKFFEGSESLLPGLLDWISTWVAPEGGGFHLTGVSNGGISAFRIAGLEPARFRSMVVFPGFPRTDDDLDRLDRLAGLPIKMFVGGTDLQWIDPMQDAAERLDRFGGDVAFEVLDGEGHIMESLSDGVRVFDELDAER